MTVGDDNNGHLLIKIDKKFCTSLKPAKIRKEQLFHSNDNEASFLDINDSTSVFSVITANIVQTFNEMNHNNNLRKSSTLLE